jgi:hypothetical protein
MSNKYLLNKQMQKYRGVYLAHSKFSVVFIIVFNITLY